MWGNLLECSLPATIATADAAAEAAMVAAAEAAVVVVFMKGGYGLCTG